MTSWEDFEKIDIRVGSVLSCQPFPEARKPAYKLEIDFGSAIGIKRSSAQITDIYQPADLIGKQIVAVINFPPKQIGPFISECLILGIYTKDGVVLLSPDKEAQNGEKIG